jgi:hypothetical protein
MKYNDLVAPRNEGTLKRFSMVQSVLCFCTGHKQTSRCCCVLEVSNPARPITPPRLPIPLTIFPQADSPDGC